MTDLIGALTPHLDFSSATNEQSCSPNKVIRKSEKQEACSSTVLAGKKEAEVKTTRMSEKQEASSSTVLAGKKEAEIKTKWQSPKQEAPSSTVFACKQQAEVKTMHTFYKQETPLSTVFVGKKEAKVEAWPIAAEGPPTIKLAAVDLVCSEENELVDPDSDDEGRYIRQLFAQD